MNPLLFFYPKDDSPDNRNPFLLCYTLNYRLKNSLLYEMRKEITLNSDKKGPKYIELKETVGYVKN